MNNWIMIPHNKSGKLIHQIKIGWAIEGRHWKWDIPAKFKNRKARFVTKEYYEKFIVADTQNLFKTVNDRYWMMKEAGQIKPRNNTEWQVLAKLGTRYRHTFAYLERVQKLLDSYEGEI